MSAERKSLLDSATGWFALGEGLRAIAAPPTVDETGEGQQDQITDPDFHRWLVNDPMVTMNPTSRYGDDAAFSPAPSSRTPS
ncbi:MAG: hypothetical protein K2Y16_06815 [Burkholderiales bacterium]|nr:hypothetical protein [Burkholderiales bacterium]